MDSLTVKIDQLKPIVTNLGASVKKIFALADYPQQKELKEAFLDGIGRGFWQRVFSTVDVVERDFKTLKDVGNCQELSVIDSFPGGQLARLILNGDYITAKSMLEADKKQLHISPINAEVRQTPIFAVAVSTELNLDQKMDLIELFLDKGTELNHPDANGMWFADYCYTCDRELLNSLFDNNLLKASDIPPSGR